MLKDLNEILDNHFRDADHVGVDLLRNLFKNQEEYIKFLENNDGDYKRYNNE